MKLTIKNRLTLAVSLLFLCLMVVTSLLVLTLFKQQAKGIISTEQSLMLTEITESIDDKLSLAQAQLIFAAPLVSEQTLGSGDAAQQFLDSQRLLQRIFDNHIFLFTPEGRIVAESPFLPDRRGLDFSFRSYIKDTVATSAPVISDPYSQPNKPPVIMMTAPVFDQEGKIIAILAGSLDLMGPNFLGRIAGKKIGTTGYLYLLTSDRVMIMHPDQSRIFKKIAEGKNPLYDRALQGFEGTDENRTREGKPMLTSFKHLRVKNWLLAANYPQQEAYAPLTRGIQLILLVFLTTTLAALAVIRYFSQYLTRPLLSFTSHVAELENKQGEARMFISAEVDEIGLLAQSFNAMLDKLDRQQEDLRQSKELYRVVTDFATDFIFWRGPDKKMIFVSRSCAQLTGYSEEEFLAAPTLLDEIFHPEDRERWASHVHSTEEETILLEFRIITKAGQVRWVSHICTEIYDDLGRYLGLRGSLADISEHKRVEQEKEGLEIQLQQAQKMESVGRLAGGVAHDFNNMLGVMIGHTDLALRQIGANEEVREHLTEINKAADRSAKLTRQLLTFARKQAVAPTMLDLNEKVTGVLTMLQRLIGEDARLLWQPQEDLWPVKMDPSQIDQILTNLCVNARDAMAGGGVITIKTGHYLVDDAYCSTHVSARPGEYVYLALSDNGCGMDQETLAKVFEPFFTTKGVGKGTGLGLSMVYGIVKQNRGFITASSEVGQGTTFTVYLPRFKGKRGKAEAGLSPAPVMGGQETILVVEDEPAMLHMTTMMLDGLGYTVLAADSADKAIHLAQQYSGEIRLLMSDVIMPETNGRDLADTLLSSLPQLKILYMSGYAADIIAHHGVLDEGVAFIQKPFSLQEVAVKVRQVLDGP